MADIVLALKPKWLELILNGKKTVECRRSMPKKLQIGDRVYLYCQGDIHGFCTVADVEIIDGNDDWESEATISTFAEYACLSEDEMRAYWQGAKRPGLIFLKYATRYDDPHPWRGSVPQNFIYYND